MNARRTPGPGWKYLGSSVYEHTTGLRIHGLGTARLPDGTNVFANGVAAWRAQDRAIAEQGYNRKRGLMVWGLSLLRPA